MQLQSNFAKLLRKIFQYSSKMSISIEQVYEFLNYYLDLEQIRFENKVDIDFIIQEELFIEEYYVPPLIIQPIIENSFKHGLFHKRSDMKLLINLKVEGPYLHCLVEDNGVGRKINKKDNMDRTSGLTTTKKRLEILQEAVFNELHPYGNIRITDLVSDSDESPLGTRVELWIPFIK